MLQTKDPSTTSRAGALAAERPRASRPRAPTLEQKLRVSPLLPPSFKIEMAPLSSYQVITDSGELQRCTPKVPIYQGQIEVPGATLRCFLAVGPGVELSNKKQPLMVVGHGWWGGAEQNLPLIDDVAARGALVLVPDLEQHGGSISRRDSFSERLKLYTGAAYVENFGGLFAALPGPKQLYLHSGAAVWAQKALDRAPEQVRDSVIAVMAAMPVAALGTSFATAKVLWQALKDIPAGHWAGLKSFIKFWGEHKALRYAADQEPFLRRVLFDDQTSSAFIKAFQQDLGPAPYLNYVISSLPWKPARPVALGSRFLLHAGGDQNYPDWMQKQTALWWDMQYSCLANIPHQAHSLPAGRRLIVDWIADKMGLGRDHLERAYLPKVA